MASSPSSRFYPLRLITSSLTDRYALTSLPRSIHRLTRARKPTMIIAYLIPIFPMPSQTFIRRKLAALEARGWTIHRFAMRRFGGGPADPADQVEQDRTHYILDAGARGLT